MTTEIYNFDNESGMNGICVLGDDKLYPLLDKLESVKHLEGDIVELGVYRGGVLKKMAEKCSDKMCYGFDTFEGLPEKDWIPSEIHPPGDFDKTAFEQTKSFMPENVILIPGYFPDTADNLDITKICFAHVDFDYEKGTKSAIDWLLPRMVPGGIIVFDDYLWYKCPGVEKAIKEAGLQITQSATYQCYWIKND